MGPSRNVLFERAWAALHPDDKEAMRLDALIYYESVCEESTNWWTKGRGTVRLDPVLYKSMTVGAVVHVAFHTAKIVKIARTVKRTDDGYNLPLHVTDDIEVEFV